MLTIHYIFIFLILLIAICSHCPIFKCGALLKENQCISHTSSEEKNEYLINLCPKDKFCDYSMDPTQSEIFCSNKPKTLLVDNEDCSSAKDCYGSQCIDGKCKGKGINEACSNTGECEIGLYCKNSKCQNQEKQGGVCFQDSDCQNNYGCSDNKTCIEYFTLEVGDKSTNYMLCKTMYTYEGYCSNLISKSGKDECDENDNKCIFTIDSGNQKISEITKNCQCSRGDNTKKYCPLDTHGKIWKDMVNKLKLFFTQKGNNFHSTRRNSFDYETKKAFYYAVNYPKYKNADSCAIDIDLNDSESGNSFFFLKFHHLVIFSLIFCLF